MSNPKLIILLLYLIAGLIIIGLSIPLIKGRIPPNSWYGFRVKRTLENPRIWYPANRYAAYHMLAMGVLILLAAITMYLLPQIDFITYALSCLGVTVVGLAIGLLRSFWHLRKLPV